MGTKVISPVYLEQHRQYGITGELRKDVLSAVRYAEGELAIDDASLRYWLVGDCDGIR